MNPDYSALLDDEVKAFVSASQSHFAHLSPDASVDQQRRAYDSMCIAMRAPRPEGLTITDDRVGGIGVRIYGQGAVTVLYIHGGGFVLGDLESHDDVCAEIAQQSGCRVVALNYRLAPEFPYPAANDDCLTVLNWIDETFGTAILLAGDSAGGSLSAWLSHQLRAKRAEPILGQVLIYPGLGGDPSDGSYIEHAYAPLLTRADMLIYEGLFAAPPDALRPLADPDMRGLPPTFVVTADCDPLRDDGRDYADAINTVGGRADWVNEPGLVHGYLRARHVSAKARASFERILGAIRAMAAG